MHNPDLPTRPAAGEDELPAQPDRVLDDASVARLVPWGLRDYGEMLALQERLRTERRAGEIPDTWLAGEHPTVITQGVRGAAHDLVTPDGSIPVFKITRGGQTTLHNPGQLVIYPIVKTQPGVLAQARASRTLLLTVRDWLLEQTGLALDYPKGRPGLFADGRKAAAIGIAINGRVTMHGVAINLCNDLSAWRWIIPCGEPDTRPVTLGELLGRRIEPAELIAAMPDLLRKYWGYARVDVAPLG